MSAAMILFYGAILFWLMTEAWIKLRERGKVFTGKDRLSRIVVIVAVALGVYFGSVLRAHPSQVELILGALIIILGVSFRIWSVRTLGKFFRTTVMVQQKQVVISHGPYKYVRHPSYLGALVALLGIGIGIGNWLGLLVMFVTIFLGLSYRISVEEKVLRAELGKPYQEYMKHTKKLIPFIY